MSSTKTYPKREKFFANRFVRALMESGAALEIGVDTCYLLMIIAHTEDAKRYKAAVSYWSDHLVGRCGFKNRSKLHRARKKAVESGWLHYEPGAKNRPARYWVIIPDVDDTPTDENQSDDEGGFGVTSERNEDSLCITDARNPTTDVDSVPPVSAIGQEKSSTSERNPESHEQSAHQCNTISAPSERDPGAMCNTFNPYPKPIPKSPDSSAPIKEQPHPTQKRTDFFGVLRKEDLRSVARLDEWQGWVNGDPFPEWIVDRNHGKPPKRFGKPVVGMTEPDLLMLVAAGLCASDKGREPVRLFASIVLREKSAGFTDCHEDEARRAVDAWQREKRNGQSSAIVTGLAEAMGGTP